MSTQSFNYDAFRNFLVHCGWQPALDLIHLPQSHWVTFFKNGFCIQMDSYKPINMEPDLEHFRVTDSHTALIRIPYKRVTRSAIRFIRNPSKTLIDHIKEELSRPEEPEIPFTYCYLLDNGFMIQSQVLAEVSHMEGYGSMWKLEGECTLIHPSGKEMACHDVAFEVTRVTGVLELGPGHRVWVDVDALKRMVAGEPKEGKSATEQQVKGSFATPTESEYISHQHIVGIRPALRMEHSGTIFIDLKNGSIYRTEDQITTDANGISGKFLRVQDTAFKETH